MENPATWTELHHELDKAYNNTDGALSIFKVLRNHNYIVTIEQVERVINMHKESLESEICGHSLCAMLVNELT